MKSYNKLYQKEVELFGTPYPRFESFIAQNALKSGKALDIGCGQGRDALMLAQYGYQVVGVDSSKVGVKQMLTRAKNKRLPVTGVVANFHTYEVTNGYDAIVLNSILHFGKADQQREKALLEKLLSHLNMNGYIFIFIHKSAKKEQTLHHWLSSYKKTIKTKQDGYIKYNYEEKSSNFQSTFEIYMLILQRISISN